MSNVFSLDLFTDKSLDVTNVLESSYIEESYFVSTLDFISETNKEIIEHSKELYKSILENKDEEVINESFSEFFTKVKEVIDKFLKFIKSLFDRFSTYLHKMIASDKFIIKNKDLFKKFNSDHDFEIDGFYYTFDESVPVIDALADFNKDFIELDFDIMNGKKTNEDVKKYIEGQLGRLSASLNNGYFDKFRAEVIGKENYNITQGEFAEELFEIFRNGNSKKDTITINQENVLSSLSFFQNYKDLEKQVKKTKDKIDKDYKAIQKSIQNLATKSGSVEKTIAITVNPDYVGGTDQTFSSTEDILTKLNLFTKAKINQVIEMSSIHSMAFSYKLDAITECYKQDKKILYTALTEIQKDKKLR